MPRIRLQSSEPLPALKAWFLVPADVTSIRDLKLALCSHLTILKDMNLHPSQLALEMDDFEVLEESPIDLVREGDLVKVKCKTDNSEQPSRKRKAIIKRPATAEKRRKLPYAIRVSSPSSSSTSSSSSSSSSSDSDSDSSSSSDSTPSIASIRQKSQKSSSNRATVSAILPDQVQQLKRPLTTKHKAQQPTVPPGYGKPSTQNRNARRRKKRLFSAGRTLKPEDLSTSTPTQGGPEDSEFVLPYDDAPMDPSSRPTPPVPSASLGNRNKAKGFKKSMEGVVPQKMVFDLATRPAPSPRTPSNILPFTPPSERLDLPKNMFVTSVDVEWRTGQGRTRWEDAEEVIDEPTEAVRVVQNTDADTQGRVDWTAIETGWDGYEKLQISTPLSQGTIVAWKAFGLDPVTLTPQAALLHLGKVMAIDTENLLLQPLIRPGVRQAAFGRSSIEEEDVELAEQISSPLTEIWSGDWRLIFKQ